MVRDEADVISHTLAHMAEQGFDRIVVADNRSVDGTREILEAYAENFWPLFVIEDDPEVAYLQSSKMSALAGRHAEEGDWVIPFDADEVWHPLKEGHLAYALQATDADIAAATPFVHVPTDFDLWTDPNPLTRIAHRQQSPEPHPKVAFRWQPGARIEMGNHGVVGVGYRVAHDVIGVRHFQYRSLEQVRRKVTNGVEAYSATNFGAMVGTHWKALAALDDESLAKWWDEYTHQDGLIRDPAPVRHRREE